MRAGNRKQALVPEGATVLEPVGTAPGLVVPPATARAAGRRAARARRASCSRCGRTARRDRRRCARCSRARARYEQRMLRLFGHPGVRDRARRCATIEADGVALDRLEITTCLRRGEIEIATVFEPRRRRRLRRASRRRSASATATRCSPTTARRSTSRSSRGCSAGRRTIAVGRVVHRRADGGAADRPRRAPRRTCWAASSSYSNEAKVGARRRAGRR